MGYERKIILGLEFNLNTCNIANTHEDIHGTEDSV